VGANSASLASAQNLNFAISAQDIQAILQSARRNKVSDLAQLDPAPGPKRSELGSSNPDAVVCHLPAQRRFVHRYKIATEVDEFDKLTWLRTEWIPLQHNDPRLATCALRVGVPYREDAPPPAVIWEVRTAAKTFAFLAPGARRFQLLIDGESVELSDPQHKGNIVGTGVTESLITLPTIQGFVKIIMAKEVKARVGVLEYQLGPAQLECLRDLASRLPTGDTSEGEVRVVRYDLADDPSVPASMKKKPRVASTKTKSGTDTDKDEFRIWKSADGKFSVEARLVNSTGDAVELKRKDDGRTIRVPRDKLSAADEAYLRERN
jgi:hypothetical protein